MAYTTINKGSSYFNTVLYTGTGATLSITGVGFQPDWVWTKGRSVAFSHYLFDSVRGTGKRLISNSTSNEDTSIFGVSSFNSDGFTLGTDTGANNSGSTFVSWNWLASNTTTSNTSGSITSTVSANTTSGFSIVSYTGTGANATVGHGLGVAPKMVIVKSRSNSTDWIVGNTNIGWTKLLRLNTTAAQETNNYFNDTAPTSSVFSLGTTVNVNGSGYTYVAYCFAEVKGYSKFGSYAGNNALDGAFVYTGFSPSFVLVKRYGGGAQNWVIYDDKRNTYNVTNSILQPNTNAAEATNNAVDLLSNGFKFRSNDGDSNGYSDGYIYMAFAENPFVTSGGIPVTAR
jgi:hypothetical protein